MLWDYRCFIFYDRSAIILNDGWGTTKLARKSYADMLNNYVEGLHREGSKAVFRYTSLELADRFALLNAAFGEEGNRV